MQISEIKVGMLLDMCGQSNMDYIDKARVEAVGHDWFVVRDEKERPWFINYSIWDLWKGDTE